MHGKKPAKTRRYCVGTPPATRLAVATAPLAQKAPNFFRSTAAQPLTPGTAQKGGLYPLRMQLYSQIEFARMAGVSKQAVAKACKATLAPACKERRVDADHPAAIDYLARHGAGKPEPLDRAVRPRSAQGRPNMPTPAAESAHGAPDDAASAATGASATPANDTKDPVRLVSREVRNVHEIADMTIRQVVAKFGTVTAFKDWLVCLRKIEDVCEKNLRNAEKNGNLISANLVRTHIMGAIEFGNQRLLTDSPKTLARMLYAAAKSGVPIEEAELMVRENISSHLRPVQETAARLLRGGKA